MWTKVHIVKAIVFPIVMYRYETDHNEGWALKNWCFWIVVLEKTLENPLDYKEIQPVHPRGDCCCVFIGGTDVEAETPILWPPDAESWLIWEDSDAGKDWGQEEKGTERMRQLDGITNTMDMGWMDSGSWWWTGRPGVLQFTGSQIVGHDWATEPNWTYCWIYCHMNLQWIRISHRSLVPDHHSNYNNDEDIWNIAGITKMWHRGMKWANVVGKMLLNMFDAQLPRTSSLLKMQYLWRTIRSEAINRGTPVCAQRDRHI